jgi:hypothetical protein
MPDWLRWVAVIPAAIAGWPLAFAITASLHRMAFALCPSAMIVSGACTAPWFQVVEFGLSCIFASLAAILIVALPTLIAPGKRRVVAWSAFGVGSLFALYIGIRAEAIAQLVVALIAGFLSVSFAGKLSAPIVA